MIRKLLLLVFIFSFSSASVYASNISAEQRTPVLEGKVEDSEIFMPFMGLDKVTIDDNDTPPFEPNIIVVKYLQDAPPRNLGERVERLVHGITVDIPPEYDIYGYELRRYMQAVGNPKIYTDNNYLAEQLKNIAKANIVLDYWRQHLKKEMEELEPLAEGHEVSFITKTAFKQNAGIVKQFLSDSQTWLDANKNFLIYLDSIEGKYTLIYPEIKFQIPEFATKYTRLLTKKQESIRKIREYTIFRLMVY